jgi:hypothetical protein
VRFISQAARAESRWPRENFNSGKPQPKAAEGHRRADARNAEKQSNNN